LAGDAQLAADLPPRLLDRSVRERARLEPESGEERNEGRPQGSRRAVVHLQGDTKSVADSAEQPLRPVLGDPAVPESHEVGVDPHFSAYQLGVASYRVSDPSPGVRRVESSE